MTTPSTADEPAPIRIVDCDQCGRTEEDVGAPLQACGSCTCAVYCSTECLIADSDRHSKLCPKLSKEDWGDLTSLGRKHQRDLCAFYTAIEGFLEEWAWPVLDVLNHLENEMCKVWVIRVSWTGNKACPAHSYKARSWDTVSVDAVAPQRLDFANILDKRWAAGGPFSCEMMANLLLVEHDDNDPASTAAFFPLSCEGDSREPWTETALDHSRYACQTHTWRNNFGGHLAEAASEACCCPDLS